MPDGGLTHLDPLGRARMVDVAPKEQTHRRAVARGRVHMAAETTSLVARGAIGKGDVLSVARVAGIQAAKRAPDLIPLCHPLPLTRVTVDFSVDRAAAAIAIDATVVRCLLVPSVMMLLGRSNWWLPGWIDRRLPRLSIEGPEAAPETAG